MDKLQRQMLIALGSTVVAYLLLFAFLDRPIDDWCHQHLAQGWIFSVGTAFSYLADGKIIRFLVALVVVGVVVIDPRFRNAYCRNLFFLCVCVAVATVIGETFKFCLARYRPVMLFDHGSYGFHYFSTEWNLHSSPSGHTLRAFAVCTFLALLNRRLTPLLISLAVLIGVSRVVVTDHYPSDVVFGAFIGVFSALWTHRFLVDGLGEADAELQISRVHAEEDLEDPVATGDD